MIRVSKADNVARKAIFLEGGLHARYDSESNRGAKAAHAHTCSSQGMDKHSLSSLPPP